MSPRAMTSTFHWLAIAETITLVVLLVNIATSHNEAITSSVGPIHGIMYLAAIVVILMIPNIPNRLRLLAAVPAIGAPLASWLLRRHT